MIIQRNLLGCQSSYERILRQPLRETVRRWIANNFGKLGVASSLNVDREVAFRLDGSPGAVADLKP
jgi:hypothetical protein